MHRAEATGYPPILAEMLASQAELELNLGNPDTASEVAWRALLLAESAATTG